jgi:hypothetical protein
MKRLLILLLFLLGFSTIASARDSVKGWCEEGNRPVITSGLTSTTRVQASHPSCTVTVYVHGGGLATIYADNNGTPLANPFTAQSGGRWQAYADDGRYDVTMSSAGFSQTVTYSDIILCDPFVAGSACGGGGGGGGADHNLLSLTHLDTVPFSPPARGDLIVAQDQTSPSGVTPAWARLPLGTSTYVLTSTGTDAVWAPATGGGGGGTSNLRVCEIIIGADNLVDPIVNGDIAPQGRQCFVAQAATLIEVDVAADDGTPSVVVDKITPGGSRTSLLSSALATAASGGVACSNATGTVGIDGVTTCSATLQNTSLPAGYYVETNTATAGGTAKRVSISLTWLITTSSGVITLQTDGVNNGSQSLLNLAAGSGITLTDDGFGQITIAGGASPANSYWDLTFPTTNAVPPVDADYSWINQVTATKTVNTGNSINLLAEINASPSWNMRVKTQPATPYTIDAAFTYLAVFNFNRVAIGFRESATGKLTLFQADFNGLLVENWTSPTVQSSQPLAPNANGYIGGLVFFRIANDGTNLIFSASPDGRNYVQLLSVAKNSFFTTAPDQVLFGVASQSVHPASMTLVSWYEH